MWTPKRQTILSEQMPTETEAALKTTTVPRGSPVSSKVDFSLDGLVRELTFIVAAKKSDLFGSSVSLLDKYSADAVPTHLLQAEDDLIRRLGSVLLAFVFQHKSDVFRVMADDRKQPFCLSQSFLFMSKYKSSMRVFHPETLPHVSNPLLFYLPKRQFPGGLPGFLDIDKLYSILITKEYLRIPDPAEMIIWLPFEDISEYSADQYAKHPRSRSESPEESSERRNLSSWAIQERDQRIGSSKGEAIVSKASPQKPRHKADVSQAERLLSVYHSEASDSSAGHRIKCFQFFKKGPKESQKRDTVSSTSEARFGLQRATDSNQQTQIARFQVKRPTTGVKSSSVGPACPKVQQATQEVTSWVTNKDYTFFTAETKLVANSSLSPVERCSSTDRQSRRESATFSNTARQELKIKSDILAALELKQLFSDITKTIAEAQLESTQDQTQAQELTEVVENDLGEDSSDSDTEESANRTKKPISSSDATRDSASDRINMFFTKSSTKKVQSSQQTESLDSSPKDSEMISLSLGASLSRPSFCTPPMLAPRRLPSTSMEKIALRNKMNPLLRQTPVSLQDYEQYENKRSESPQKGPKITILRPESNSPTITRKLLQPADEDLQPISRMRNGGYFRLIPDLKETRNESLDRSHLRGGQRERSDSQESKKEFRISAARTATSLLTVPKQTPKFAEPARRTEQEPRINNQQPGAGARPVLFVKKVKQSLMFKRD